MNNWRSSMIKETKALLYCLKVDSQQKVMDLFENEFRELIVPIEEEYPDVCKLIKDDDSLTLSIGKSTLELKNAESNTINVFISRISSDKGKPTLWGVMHIEDVTYIEMLLPQIRKGQKIFLDKSLVDDLFKTTFEQPWFFDFKALL